MFIREKERTHDFGICRLPFLLFSANIGVQQITTKSTMVLSSTLEHTPGKKSHIITGTIIVFIPFPKIL